jgi:hypothetical protein
MLSGYAGVNARDDALQIAVLRQPIAGAVDASSPAFRFYGSGVLTSLCRAKVNQGILVVGFGWDDGIPYWKLKNSWGTSWGEEGFIRISRNTTVNQGQGQCGILKMLAYPISAPTTKGHYLGEPERT